jgi:hypothetical protein
MALTNSLYPFEVSLAKRILWTWLFLRARSPTRHEDQVPAPERLWVGPLDELLKKKSDQPQIFTIFTVPQSIPGESPTSPFVATEHRAIPL